MMPKLKAFKANQDVKELQDAPKIINYHEEYHKALRTKSYADFFNKAQSLANQPSILHNHNIFSEILLEPWQETIPSIIDTISFFSKTPKLKKLMLSFFDISAEASFICSNLLKSINQVKSNHEHIQRAINIMDDDHDDETLKKIDQINFELNSFFFSNNPFSNLNNNEFKLINDNQTSMLKHLKTLRKRVGRKIKIMKYLKKIFGIGVGVACSLVAITATIIATHTLTILIMVPAMITFPYRKVFKRKLQSLRNSRSKFLGKVYDQVDIATKGSYILNRDFDTMSRLVARIYDEIEHNRAMVKFCLERRDKKFSFQIVREFEKSDDGFRKQVEELQEHVYLCLLTINRARGLVIKEITKTCAQGNGM